MVVKGAELYSVMTCKLGKPDAVQEASAARFWNARGRGSSLGLVEYIGYHRAPGLYMIADALFALACKLVGTAAPCCAMLCALLPAVAQAGALADLEAATPP